MLSSRPTPFTLTVALNAATNVSLVSSHSFVHAALFAQFRHNVGQSVRLEARSTPFHSVIVALGHVDSRHAFHLSHAVTLRNGSSIDIPLRLAFLPSAGEFESAVASLSPEQQRFANAVRSMQLATSSLSLVVIPLLPNLAAALNVSLALLVKSGALSEQIVDWMIRCDLPLDLLRVDQRNSLQQLTANVENIAALMQQQNEQELQKKTDQTAAVAAHETSVNISKIVLTKGMVRKAMSVCVFHRLRQGRKINLFKNSNEIFATKRKRRNSSDCFTKHSC